MKDGKHTMNLFTALDHAIIRSAMRRLPGLLAEIVEMRFWRGLAIEEIAVDLGVTRLAVERALLNAMRILREECLRNPAFSRSRYSLLQAIDARSVA